MVYTPQLLPVILIAIPSVIGFLVSLRRFFETSQTGFGLILGGFLVLLFGAVISIVGLYLFPLALFQQGMIDIFFGFIFFLSLLLISVGIWLIEAYEGYY